MNNNFALKELYDISLTALAPIAIGNTTFQTGEAVLFFDKLQMSSMNEIKSRHSTRGGKTNIEHITWERTTSEEFICESGIISQQMMAVLSNSQIAEITENTLEVPKREIMESDVDGEITLSYIPLSREFFIYDSEMKKVDPTQYTVTGKVISGLTQYKIYTISYIFIHTSAAQTLFVGKRLFNGYFKLTAKMRVKDDKTGEATTAVFTMPKVRLVSDLSMRLGSYVTSNVSSFRITGEPVGERNNEYVCSISYLDKDVDIEPLSSN